MNSELSGSPSRDQQSGDNDQPYAWGRPAATYLPFRTIVRLTILRSKLETRSRLDTRTAVTH
jgi:hypothetical protein